MGENTLSMRRGRWKAGVFDMNTYMYIKWSILTTYTYNLSTDTNTIYTRIPTRQLVLKSRQLYGRRHSFRCVHVLYFLMKYVLICVYVFARGEELRNKKKKKVIGTTLLPIYHSLWDWALFWKKTKITIINSIMIIVK